MDVEAAARLLESYASQHGLTRAERDAVLDRIATRRRDSCQETGVPADILDWQRRTTERAAFVATEIAKGHTDAAYETLLMMRADLTAALALAESLDPGLIAVRQGRRSIAGAERSIMTTKRGGQRIRAPR
ncbi:hypothetical protein [Salinispora cortesiana]|uniref:hypothetical protein n=1 Tax=Salinispora cortesiana TaxID=1305843 RepID=UPI0004277971|nr:hypothetical protein [Salinispora cortesiana]